MAFEQVVLDPDEVAVNRGEVDITPWIAAAGVDWGTAEITAYMAEQKRGATMVDYRLPNRTVVIPFVLKDMPDDLTFFEIRTALQGKCSRFQAEGGWLKRVVTDSDTSVYLDIVNASLVLGGDWLQAHRDVDLNAQLTLECLPEFYGDEVTLSDHTETTLPELVFTETGVLGDYPGRLRWVVDDDSGVDQRGAIWSIRSRHYSAATTGSVAYQAETLAPLDTATRVAKAGSSGGTVVTHGTLSTNWTPVLGTNMGGTTWLTHTGTNRLYARVHSTAGTTVQARFVWDVGDFAYPVENPPVRLYHAAGSAADSAGYHVLDLGELRLDPVATGSHRWQGQIQAKGDAGAESFSIDRIWVVNADDGAGVLRAPYTIASNLGTFSARSEFNTESGAITGDSLAVGGVWTGAGDADDFSVAATLGGNAASRTGVSDADLNTGRYVTASSPTLSDTVVQAYFLTSNGAITGSARYGVLARYVDTSNWLWFGITVTSGVATVAVIKRVAGTVTTLQAVGSGGAPSGLPRPPSGSQLQSNTFFGLRLVASGGGFYSAAMTISASSFVEVLSGYDSVLATGATLDDGKVGIYDAQTSATAATRYYLQFGAWAPPRDAVAMASQSVELGTSQIIREDSSGVAYSPVTYVTGDLPRIPPATLDNRTTEFFVKLSRGDLQTLPDPNIDDISAQVTYRPCWIQTPET